MTRTALLVAFLLPALAYGQLEELVPLEDDEPDDQSGQARPSGPEEAAPVILEEFTVDERDVVLSAARTRTTIQEAPGIITVITAEQIRQRGFRTINDVLRTVPGFEGGRYEGNGWFNESAARGQPRTLLILVNGVNVTEPVRNSISLDRKIPVHAVKRVEVTSGPGGVLWGSNALLGVVNIILKDSSDLDGFEVSAGGGHGRSAQEAVGASAAYGANFLGGDVELYTSLDFYSDRGAELEVDAIKALGVLPEPAPDGTTFYLDRSDKTDFNSRDWWLTSTLQLTLWDDLTLDWLLSFEQDHRQIATGGAILRGTDGEDEREVTRETVGDDSIQMVGLNWRDRFLDDRFGVSAKLYGVRFVVEEDPFWAFTPRYLGEIRVLEEGVVIGLHIERMLRLGANIDADLDLGPNHHLLFGTEAFLEHMRGATRDDTLRLARVRLERGGEEGLYNAAMCPAPGTYTDPRSGKEVEFRADCVFNEELMNDADRLVGALYISDVWKLNRSVAIQPGFRFQASNAYDPVPLFSGALVWNLFAKVYLKLNYAEGFRPPEFQATEINDASISSVSFESGKDIQVEQSRATEAEVNAVVLEDAGFLDRVYLRGDYAYTLLRDVIRNEGGQFVNSGERGIHSVEFLARADFEGDHELWFGGHFVTAEDSEFGPVRNSPNWVLSGGVRLTLIAKHLELSTLANYIGAREDLNRASDGAEAPIAGATEAQPSDVEVDLLDPYLLLNVGLRAFMWEERVELSAWVYNLLDEQWQDPDFSFDDRVLSRPQARGGWSAFGQASVRF